MSGASNMVDTTGGPLTRDDLIGYLEQGCKPPEQWRIGTEHEKFGYHLDDLRPLEYDGPRGIRAMLEGLQRFGWDPVIEKGNVIALSSAEGGSVTLEPGGQFELSGAPLETLHQTCAEVNEHLRQVKEVAHEIGAGFLGLGFNPKWTRADTPVMPKGRYGIMRRYMPTKGDHGLDMMLRSCTVQVNLDFASEADMVKKFRASLALQPIVTAMFANSPFVEGKPSGYMSYRSFVWTDTDPDRCGMLPFVFDDGFGFEAYAEHALNVPMYFVYRDGKYIDAAGQSFRDFMAGKLPAYPGHTPTMNDWVDHLTTLFPEVRMKRFLEMRGADGGPWGRLCALPAVWVGLLYDDTALDAAWDLAKGWSIDQRETLRRETPRTGLTGEIEGLNVLDLAREVVKIADAGLKARGRHGAISDDETEYLLPLKQIVEDGRSPAQALLDAYESRWGGSVDPVFTEQAY
ncbi:MAG: glutamate--cysteine ligase [Alphaproteobacteria bacterium]